MILPCDGTRESSIAGSRFERALHLFGGLRAQAAICDRQAEEKTVDDDERLPPGHCGDGAIELSLSEHASLPLRGERFDPCDFPLAVVENKICAAKLTGRGTEGGPPFCDLGLVSFSGRIAASFLDLRHRRSSPYGATERAILTQDTPLAGPHVQTKHD